MTSVIPRRSAMMAWMKAHTRNLCRWLLLGGAGALGIWFSLTGLAAVAMSALSVATTLGYAGPEPKNSNNITIVFGAYSLIAIAGALGSWFACWKLWRPRG